MTELEIDFGTVYGTLFSLATTTEYLECVDVLFAKRKVNYLQNKAVEANKQCKVVYNLIEKEMNRHMSAEQRSLTNGAVEQHKELIYDFFKMDAKDQVRIKGLMNKILKEKQPWKTA